MSYVARRREDTTKHKFIFPLLCYCFGKQRRWVATSRPIASGFPCVIRPVVRPEAGRCADGAVEGQRGGEGQWRGDGGRCARGLRDEMMERRGGVMAARGGTLPRHDRRSSAHSGPTPPVHPPTFRQRPYLYPVEHPISKNIYKM
jgi:hypothetical protein